ncbi:hypothetical protein BofuT4_P039830.1 [Botrytis cinerea T4]|uniref:Uncharacterized protein n=1 Tax=Botryotinia fuckeliana (strain T4) TaxID=999810 RepID=G2Y341_BOTF4|nr:hypothetical protein BofuT4_P039830.1 [Botrytis cinerea T4]
MILSLAFFPEIQNTTLDACGPPSISEIRIFKEDDVGDSKQNCVYDRTTSYRST